MNTQPWSLLVPVTDLPETGRRVDLAADAATRAAVAKAVGLDSLPRLEATFDLTPHGRKGVRVAGQVSATVGQLCVLTLEPVENQVEEAVDLLFEPPRTNLPNRRAHCDPDDPPEVLRDGVIDLGAVATEFLILGIDPYPRKPGAVFTAPQQAQDSHPFAALAAWKAGKRGPTG